MCGDSKDPAGAVRCVGIWCIVLGILGGVTSPSSITAIVVGSIASCCSSGAREIKQQSGCLRSGAITGLVLTTIETISFIVLGLILMGAYGSWCETVQDSIEYSCAYYGYSSSGRRLADASGGVLSRVVMPPVLHWDPKPAEPMSFALYNRTIHEHSRLVSLLPAEQAKLLTHSVPAILKLPIPPPPEYTKFAAANAAKLATLAHAPKPASPGVAHGRHLNSDGCGLANDGDCDDGGPGSEFSMCTCGEDLSDCGSRSTSDCSGSSSGSGSGAGGYGVIYVDGNVYYASECEDVIARYDNICNTLNLIALMIAIVPSLIDILKIIAFSVMLCHLCALDRASGVAPAVPGQGQPPMAATQGVQMGQPVAMAQPMVPMAMAQPVAVAQPVPQA